MNCAELVTALSIAVYQPVHVARKQCRLHPNRTNCALLQTKGLNRIYCEHITTLDARYCSTNGDPYYEWLTLNDNNERTRLKNGYSVECSVKYTMENEEELRSLEEAGEYDVQIVKKVLRFVYEYLNSDRGALNGHAKDDIVHEDAKVYLLFKEMYVQCLYSHLQCIILPQEMYCLYKEGEEPALNSLMYFRTYPEYEDSVASQHIYKAFLVYNTVLTMMLSEKNPFNDKSRAISKVIESVGTCNGGMEGGKRSRIKVCELKFGTSSPPANHVMCPPKEMVKLIYRYAKWHLKPKNYSRYYTMLIEDTPKRQEQLREWAIFINGFKTHFFPTP
uniref:Vp1054 n=1 Tax=Cydia pomonella granulosis virus TaxID=28289 RepID=A0A097P0X4_GVCP|nr:ORF138 vp1054 [Cydia pomonella granulovirus]QDW81197.1 vp1054 [Cydia pomonella granulovirus]QGY99441.1 VP1054 [Cydia pomonella granulovirus]QGY99867.1 VP1054 [Cydia pomonella granulovirus]QGZ00009.1 VP1054 [Cydia pomonella granulovirus]